MELTAEQVNLLAALSCWNITENAKTFKKFFEIVGDEESGYEEK